MNELEKLRNEIDEIDQIIVSAFEKRISIAKKIALYKMKNDKEVQDISREAALLKSRQEMLTDCKLNKDVVQLFETLMSISRVHQQKIVAECTESEIKKVNNTVCVGFQGIKGAYSDIARKLFFGDGKSMAYQSFEEVFAAVSTHEIDFGVLPIENSYAGSVEQVYDLLNQYDVSIVAEQLVEIDHALLGIEGAKISDICEVYSHDQAFLQCADYLNLHSDWKLIPYYNTAISAEYVAECKDLSKAAIASVYAGEVYGLEILQKDIHSNGENTTRFIIIGTDKYMEKDADKASISFSLEHKTGSLSKVLDYFADCELNMVKIESRPLKNRNFEYVFYVDFEGEFIYEKIERVKLQIKKYCTQVRILGVYKK
ncbi:MAG: prephenate dehydratase domain-containing protein [Christensenellaceae bacterium]